MWKNKKNNEKEEKDINNKKMRDNKENKVNSEKKEMKNIRPRISEDKAEKPRSFDKPNKSREIKSEIKTKRPIRRFDNDKIRNENLNFELDKNENTKRASNKNIEIGPESVEIIPLGGLEEIGKNSAVIKYKDEMILIDVGLSFPDISMLGVDIVAPDFTYVNKNAKKLKAVILTHGHEDHIGSIEYFFRKFPNKDVPVYGSKFTLGLVRGKLNENWSNKKYNLIEAEGRQKVRVSKNIEVEFINITHSIPQAFTIAIHTPAGTVVHTGDYKFDLTPVDGKLTDFYKLAELGEKGVLALLSDSTNANKEEFTLSEKFVGTNFRRVLQQAKGRIIVASFASHVHRVQQLATIAHEFGRKTALDGRSMLKAFEVGLEMGEMVVPSGSIIPLSKVPTMPEDKTIIICTGTQGEQMSVLTRMSRGAHKDIKINENDTIIISATFIPGNERAIVDVINDLMRKGAKVLYEKGQGLHVSGHGARGDIRLMLNLIKPKYFVPVHGEYMHLKSNKQLAMEFGMKDENVFLIKNGDVLAVSDKGAKIIDTVEFGAIMLEDDRTEGVEHNILKERQIMSTDGLVIILAVFDSKKKILSSAPQIITKGYPSSQSSEQLLKDLSEMMIHNYTKHPVEGLDVFLLRKEIKERAMNVFRKTQRNPMILPVVINI